MDGMPLTLDEIYSFYPLKSKPELKIILEDLVEKGTSYQTLISLPINLPPKQGRLAFRESGTERGIGSLLFLERSTRSKP